MERIRQVTTELFASAELVDSSGRHVPSLESSGVKIVALYFSAHWCPPCRRFTPLLRAAFQDYAASNSFPKHILSVVFVSGDRSVSQMQSYMKEAHGNWPGVEPGSYLQQTLNTAFQVTGIPSLIVINNQGEVLCREGQRDIMSLGSKAFHSWNSLYVDLDTSVVDLLKDNPPNVTKDAAEILVKLFSNIIRDPNSMKFRQIRLTNPKIESKLLSANGAFDVLFSVGFEEAKDDSLLLPFDANMSLIKAFRDAVESLLKPPEPSSSPIAGSLPTAPLQHAHQSEDEFLNRILGEHQLCLTYEDPETIARAIDVVPVDKLRQRATEKLNRLRSEDSKITDHHLDDLVVLELLDWFKADFFAWMDNEKCDVCTNQSLNFKRRDEPDPNERSDGAGSVEVFCCESCSKEVRLPRYHGSPRKLLEWRKGRCGEWANCFALLLRALGYDARRVLDWTDHVWCEFYSKAESRWIHLDPCENVMDCPLLYEGGWNKKLTYCIAVSKDEVQDVTWRYCKATNDTERRETLSRRTEVKEEWLTKTILDLTDKYQRNLDESTKKILRQRRLKEIVELMTPQNRQLAEKEKLGRQTGTLSWRLARGEAGDQHAGKSFVLTEREVETKLFHLEFDVLADKYVRVSDGNSTIDGWQKGVKECENLFRKEESDWKMVYLARREGALKANISWSLDLRDTDLSVKSVELLVESKTYESGRAVWQLCGGNQCVLPMSGVTMKTDQLCGSKELKIGATLTGGKGDVAWQHAQLFRAEVGNGGKPQFKLVVKLQQDG